MPKKKNDDQSINSSNSPQEDSHLQDEDLITNLQDQIAVYESKWKRAIADYQNLEKRIELHQSQMIRLAGATLLKNILNPLDDLHRAANHIQDQGLQMVIKQFEDVLNQEGLQEIPTDGKDYDPHTMECLETVPGQLNQVIQTRQKGYTYFDSVLRPAKVTVGNGEN